MPTLWLDENKNELVLIDQTKLPNREAYLRISDAAALYDVIITLAVRGAPAIGVAAAIGLYCCAVRFEDSSVEGFRYSFKKTAEYIAASRPTAKNLFWAIERMQKAADREASCIDNILTALKNETVSIYDEDIDACLKIGRNGYDLFKNLPRNTDNGYISVLTHCNAGSLAAVEYGTALSPIYYGAKQGLKFKIYADETRPLLQGARLTCYELTKNGFDVTLLCDNMAASLMAAGKIDAVIVGADRIAKNFDFANKIGTLSLAVNAKYFGVPFYVAAPVSTFDYTTATGADIVIEQRSGNEVTDSWYSDRMAPFGIDVYNPAFDVTPHRLVTAIITENGVVRDFI